MLLFRIKLFIVLIIILSISACSLIDNTFIYSQAANPEPSLSSEFQLVESIFIDVIIPKHERLNNDLHALSDQADRFCIQPSNEQFDRLKRSWRQAMTSWSNIGSINFGPIDDTNAAWRFQFWPDPLNYVHRKFQSRLSGSNHAISREELSEASVAIQGLSALEYLLFEAFQYDYEYYLEELHICKILTGTTRNLAEEAEKLLFFWQGNYQTNWLNKAKDLGDKEFSKRHLEIIFNGMLTNLLVIKDRKLAGPLGLKVDEKSQVSSRNRGRIKPNYLESWRSKTSLENIRANLQAMEALYIMPNGFSWYLTHQNKNLQLDARIRELFSKLSARLEFFESSAYEQLVSSNFGYLEQLHEDVSELFSILRFDYMQELNLQFRFNSHDGD